MAKEKTQKSLPSLCFVVGPIGKDGSTERKHADLLLHSVIKHVLETEEFGYKVKRADEDADPGMIGDRVIADIIHAPLVVADLTDLNPNAFYELGIRHSTELPTVHIAKNGTPLPFDNVAHRTIFVDLGDWHSIEQARARLRDSVRSIRAPQFRVSNPITQANASFKMRQSEDPREQLIAEMHERLSMLESALSSSSSPSRSGRAREHLADRFAYQMRRLWQAKSTNSEIVDAAIKFARLHGLELSDVRMDGNDLMFECTELDVAGFDLAWKAPEDTNEP